MLHGISRRRGYLIGPRRTALSLAIASALTLPVALHAQESPPPAPAEGEELETVVVTGFRQALVSSIEVKREATSVVEAVSAEDIGKLPESSIAESLARLPGVAGQRVNGRTSAISIRGFGQDFVAATMNGRELLGMGDNRGVEFDLYPSEIIAGATVYKTPTATLLTQGVAGTVDLQTTKPLSSPSTIAVNGMYEQNEYDSLNPDMDNTGYRGALTYVDQFMEDTLGVALTVATMESPSQEEYFEAWGYAQMGDGDSILGGVKPLRTLEHAEPRLLLGHGRMEADRLPARHGRRPLHRLPRRVGEARPRDARSRSGARPATRSSKPRTAS